MKKITNLKNMLGQSRVVRILRYLIAQNITWKTLLFSGIDGSGKKDGAIAFAAAWNCQANVSEIYKNNIKTENEIEGIDGCGVCRICRMIAENHHPDVLQINFKESDVVTISDIRILLDKISMRPCISRYKIVIIPQVHKIKSEVVSALLKFLEGHNKQVMTILTTSSQMNLLPEIVSYCHVIHFKPVNDEIIKKSLEKNNLKPEIIEIIANLSFGNMCKAEKLVTPRWNDKRRWLIYKFSSICCNMATNMDIREELVLSKILSKSPNMINDYLTIIILWLRDVLIYKLDPGRIYNLDMKETISMASQNMDYVSILNKINIIQIAQRDISKTNINLRLLTEEMMIRIGGHGRVK